MFAFYMLMMEIFRIYSDKKRTSLYWFVMITGVARMLFMLLPGNGWGEETPLLYSWIRNGMLTVIGIIIASLFLRQGLIKNDKTLKLFAICIYISYFFYLPVILFVHHIPMIGMLMIPKTCAYVAIAVIGLKGLFRKSKKIN